MTLDQWLSIFYADRDTHVLPNTMSGASCCDRVVALHAQKDRLIEHIVQVQRTNIRKLIDQQELPLINDFFKDSDRGVGSTGSDR